MHIIISHYKQLFENLNTNFDTFFHEYFENRTKKHDIDMYKSVAVRQP